MATQPSALFGHGESPSVPIEIGSDNAAFEDEFDAHYGLLPVRQTVLVRAHSNNTDDLVLAEIQPKFIVMFEPDMEFIRRIEASEVYQSSNRGLGSEYHMIYRNCCAEHHRGDAQFRSTLPSLLHASKPLVIPATLTVGDYILTPHICIEHKSLIGSFNSGRLYTQCELICAHYKQPVLLIEFEGGKVHSSRTTHPHRLSPISNHKSSSPSPTKQNAAEAERAAPAPLLHNQLVLPAVTFPRVRIIWVSSPCATAEIFNDLEANSPEPSPTPLPSRIRGRGRA